MDRVFDVLAESVKEPCVVNLKRILATHFDIGKNKLKFSNINITFVLIFDLMNR
jgi:hypothetical protein